MLKTLLKKQLFEINRSFFYDQKKGKARSKASSALLIGLYALLVVGVLGGMFTLMAVGLCEPLVQAGLGWLYFTICSLIAIALGVFGSVFNTYSGLYLAKDNDLLLSMPIPVRYILISRLLGVYLMGLLFSGMVMLPMTLVYFFTVELHAAAVIGCILLMLLISIFVMFLSCLLGWVVAKISLKLKNRSFITVFISIVFFGAYYFVYFKAQTWLQQIIANAAAYGSAIRGKAYPLYLLGRVGEGDWLAMGIVSAVILGLFALLCLLLSRSFLRIATATGRTARTVYREKAARVSSVSSALLRKELRRFTASPNYMLNCGFGLLFLPAGGILLLVMGSSLAETVSEIFETWPGSVPVLFCTAICLLASMNDMAAPSVSLEGRSAWLLQSLPVRPWQVLRAKLSVQLLLTAIPTAFCAVCAMIVLPGSLPERLLMAAAALVFVLMMALFDLTVGTKWANPAWTNEITPIKQSMSVTLALFGAWFFAIVLGGGYLLLGWHLGCAAYLGIACAVMLGLSALMLGWLRRRGAEKFASM